MKSQTQHLFRSVTLPIITVLLSFIASITTTFAADDSAPNLLASPSFEKGQADSPTGWITYTWAGKGEYKWVDGGRNGGKCVEVSSTEGVDGSWQFTAPIKPNTYYQLQGWIKTENVRPPAELGSARPGRGVQLNLHNFQPLATKPIGGTNDWTKVKLLFNSGNETKAIVNCLVGGWGVSVGRAWFDDLTLTEVSSDRLTPEIMIDGSKTFEPMPKYIYGQFIEHLGRCIYGGIWAEMLEDRKFWYAVGENSPWSAIGRVAMITDDSFAGEQTPEITVEGKPAGIAQSELGLVEGNAYTGYVWLAGDESVGPVRVSLIWGDSEGDCQTITIDKISSEYKKYPLKFTAGASTLEGKLEITATGQGTYRIGTASLMPADNIEGFRADTLALLKELDAPVYRWPGGNFVSGYDWHDGIGPRDRRPPRKNPAWKGVEHNDVGIDEFMTLCRLLDTEGYIAVNAGLGGVEAAVEELEYVNGSKDTKGGRLRAENGHTEPYGVKWWGIGNEMYGGWQLGHMSMEKYIAKHNEFARAMRAADPTIKLVAVGETGSWSEGMMQHCADAMDLISEHFYVQGKSDTIAHTYQVPSRIRAKADAHRSYRERFDSLKGKDIRIAMDEWNYWYGPHVYGELGTRYFLKDALGIAAGVHEFSRQTDIVFMANYAQTVNVIGCIKTSKTDAAFATTGLVLKLYRQRFGTIPVKTDTDWPIDAAAALTADRKQLTVAVVNPTPGKLDLPVALSGLSVAKEGTRYEIAGDDPMLYNEPGKEPAVQIKQSSVEWGEKLQVRPLSATIFVFDIKE